MLREAIFVDSQDACRVKCEVIRLVKGDALRCAVDIHALHRAVALHDALATCVIGVAARLAVIA